jgi:hypothetical protein
MRALLLGISDYMKKLLLLTLCLHFCAGVNAQAIQTGYITKLLVNHDYSAKSERVIVGLGSNLEEGFCSDTSYWEINLSTEAEKAQYSMLLASYMAGKQVKIWGQPYESCISNHERIRNVEVVQ